MILAIESSCDESALARFDPASGVVGEWVHSQIDLHKEYGGVVPDLASREHLKNFFPLLDAAGLAAEPEDITQIAVTNGPGLAGCLALGIAFARSLGLAWGVPVVGVNHLRGHAYSPFIALHQKSPERFVEAFQGLLPHLGLIVSGGNTILFEINTERQLSVLAETVDDAAGEALDKGAKLLGLPYPGGPQVECLAASGDPKLYDFPKAIAPRNERRFSFSGLKTSLRYRLEKMADTELETAIPDICAGYQGAVIAQLVGKTKHLILAGDYRSLGLSGGVSNNKALRAAMDRLAGRYRMPCLIAQPKHTGDNAAMIAFAAFADAQGLASDDFSIEPALRLASKAVPASATHEKPSKAVPASATHEKPSKAVPASATHEKCSGMGNPFRPEPKSCAIFGAGLSARAARRLAQSRGLEVVLFDQAGEGDCSTFEAADVAQFVAFVFSPGFAAEHPWRVLAEASGLPCQSEIAFAAGYWKGKIIGITGTNGKTTLTALIHKALGRSQHVSVAAGNIGDPFSDAALSDANQPEAYAVLEVSSFQAELPEGLELDALLWTNFAEDHLDRYSSMSRYFSAKANLFKCLKPDGICVVGPQVADWLASLRPELDACTVAHVHEHAHEDEHAALIDQLSEESVFRRYPNSENFSLAAELWQLLGEPNTSLIAAADTFSLAPHRLNVVAEREGVRFWDDSKATNFHATLAAIKSFERPIVWIGGGRSKGGDVESFIGELVGQIDAACLYGEVAEQLAAAFEGSLKMVQVHPRFKDAVVAAAELASRFPSANVLLSPGFASFDQFASYDARGKSFIDTVLSLKNTRKPS